MANKTGSKAAKKPESERDIFCVVSDAFRCFAQRSSVLLGSAWAFCAAALVILVHAANPREETRLSSKAGL